MPGAVCRRGVKLSAVLGSYTLASSFWSHQPQGLCSSPPVEGALIRGGNKISWQLTVSHAIHTLVLCLPLSSLFSSQTVCGACRCNDRKKTLADLGSWLWCHIAYCELTDHRSATQKPPYFLLGYKYYILFFFVGFFQVHLLGRKFQCIFGIYAHVFEHFIVCIQAAPYLTKLLVQNRVRQCCNSVFIFAGSYIVPNHFYFYSVYVTFRY